MIRHLAICFALSAPILAQGVYTNAVKPGDPICSRVVVALDPTLERHEMSDSNPSGALMYQQGHQFFPPDLRKDVSLFTAYDEKGKGVSIASLKGKIVIVGFWSVHCDPSARMVMEMAQLEKNKDKFGFELLAVDFDGNDVASAEGSSHMLGGRAAVGRFLTQSNNRDFFNQNPLTVYLPGTGKEGPSNFLNSFDSMPAMFTVDPQGRLAAIDIGYTPKLTAIRLSALIRERQAAPPAAK
jgi:hypothetical protein